MQLKEVVRFSHELLFVFGDRGFESIFEIDQLLKVEVSLQFVELLPFGEAQHFHFDAPPPSVPSF